MTLDKRHRAKLSSPVERSCCVWVVLALLSATACTERPTDVDACYPENQYPLQWVDDGPPVSGGVCEWENAAPPRPDDPTTVEGAFHDLVPDGYVGGGGAYSYCFDLGEGEVCDACPADATDDLIREKFEAECGKPVDHFLRGCYYLYDFEDGRRSCCYTALIAPECDPLHDDHSSSGGG